LVANSLLGATKTLRQEVIASRRRKKRLVITDDRIVEINSDPAVPIELIHECPNPNFSGC
jgi:hypothetical protein